MSACRLVYSVLLQLLIYGSLLFLPAGTIHWWRAWFFLGVVVVAGITSMLAIFRQNPDLLNERLKPPIQEGQPLTDKIILILFVTSYFALTAFIPLDVFRFHLMARPSLFVSSLGLFLFIAGWLITAMALKANTFAAPVVRLQKERHQKVIDTGVYSIIRHPMYAGGLLLMIGMPLWLESYAAALFAIVPIILLVLRILIEERFLRRELAGYEEYMRRVRWRLVPFVW